MMSSGVIDQTKARFSLVTFLPVLKLLPSDKSERKSMLLDLDAAVRTLDLCLSFPVRVLMLLPGPHFHIHVELVCLASS